VRLQSDPGSCCLLIHKIDASPIPPSPQFAATRLSLLALRYTSDLVHLISTWRLRNIAPHAFIQCPSPLIHSLTGKCEGLGPPLSRRRHQSLRRDSAPSSCRVTSSWRQYEAQEFPIPLHCIAYNTPMFPSLLIKDGIVVCVWRRASAWLTQPHGRQHDPILASCAASLLCQQGKFGPQTPSHPHRTPRSMSARMPQCHKAEVREKADLAFVAPEVSQQCFL
jgi:hypothetical protein